MTSRHHDERCLYRAEAEQERQRALYGAVKCGILSWLCVGAEATLPDPIWKAVFAFLTGVFALKAFLLFLRGLDII